MRDVTPRETRSDPSSSFEFRDASDSLEPPKDTLAAVRGQKDEKIKPGKREIYVHYGEGMGTSKLVIPAAKTGTARNMNTVAALVKMVAEL